jgi:simple sugar transport system ATP-binding protein
MKNISKRYAGVQALDAVDFDIARGEIHCLVGENGSGKSTLIKIISGAVQPDPGGHIEIEGERFHDYHSIEAIRKGIEVIYQDLSLFPNLSVAENIALSQVVAAGDRLINWREVQRIARRATARIGVNLPLDETVGEISIADQQLVAICRALTRDVRLVIMDEPTASLTHKEVDALFAVVRDLQAKGIATLFVSHKLNEVLQIAERVTVLRDGRKIGSFASRELDDPKLTMLMTGKQLAYSHYTPAAMAAEPVLEVRGLCLRGNFRDITFSLYPGEILGITGLLGSGRTELALSLFGVNPAQAGEMRLDGRPVRITSVQQAMRLGIGYVPENRLVQGLVSQQSVARNIVLTVIEHLVNRLRLVDQRQVQHTVQRGIEQLAIRTPSPDVAVKTLSGGNQQRVVLAKWIATQPRVLILDGPTIGIDVAAKSAIHDIIRELARRGIAIIMISDEVPEVYHNCNRVLVMHKGRLVAEFDTSRAGEHDIQNCISRMT